MSHVSRFDPISVDLQITNLEALGLATSRCGAELITPQSSYYERAIQLPGEKTSYRHIGVQKSPAHKDAYQLAYDTDYTNHELLEKLSDKEGGPFSKLLMMYKLEEAKLLAQARGMVITEVPQLDGRIDLRLSPRAGVQV